MFLFAGLLLVFYAHAIFTMPGFCRVSLVPLWCCVIIILLTVKINSRYVRAGELSGKIRPEGKCPTLLGILAQNQTSNEYTDIRKGWKNAILESGRQIDDL